MGACGGQTGKAVGGDGGGWMEGVGEVGERSREVEVCGEVGGGGQTLLVVAGRVVRRLRVAAKGGGAGRDRPGQGVALAVPLRGVTLLSNLENRLIISGWFV